MTGIRGTELFEHLVSEGDGVAQQRREYAGTIWMNVSHVPDRIGSDATEQVGEHGPCPRSILMVLASRYTSVPATRTIDTDERNH